MIIRNKFWRILTSAAGAWFLLNFTMSVVVVYFFMNPLMSFHGPSFSENFEMLVYVLCGWGMFVGFDKHVLIILPLILLILAFSIGFWIKERSWLGAGILIIAGTAVGWTRIYFFGFPFAAICGCCITLFGAWLVHFLPVFGKDWDTHIFTKSFWTRKFTCFTLSCILGIPIYCTWLYFDYHIFPHGGKVLSYSCNDFKEIAGYDANMAISINARDPSSGDIVETCIAALNYIKEKYGYDYITVHVSQTPRKLGFNFPEIGVCKYNWRGEYWNGNDLEEWHYKAYIVGKNKAHKMVPESMIPQSAAAPPVNPEALPHIPTEEELLAEGIGIAREFELLRRLPNWQKCLSDRDKSGLCASAFNKFHVFDSKARRFHLDKPVSLANDLNSFIITARDKKMEESEKYWQEVMKFLD